MGKRLPIPYRYIVKKDIGHYNAVHKFFHIWIRPNTPKGILAQEIMEEDFLAVRVHLPGLLIGLLVGCLMGSTGYLDPEISRTLIVILSTVAGGVLGVVLNLLLFQKIWGKLTGWHRLMELRGQMVEAVWNSRFMDHDLSLQVMRAAQQLAAYDQFKGDLADEIYDLLMDQRTFAERWVKENAEFVYEKAADIRLERKV